MTSQTLFMRSSAYGRNTDTPGCDSDEKVAESGKRKRQTKKRHYVCSSGLTRLEMKSGKPQGAVFKRAQL